MSKISARSLVLALSLGLGGSALAAPKARGPQLTRKQGARVIADVLKSREKLQKASGQVMAGQKQAAFAQVTQTMAILERLENWLMEKTDWDEVPPPKAKPKKKK